MSEIEDGGNRNRIFLAFFLLHDIIRISIYIQKVLSMTKVDVFSGFLGAGKTTLIKKMIQEAYKGQKLVLIENEFGEIGIDGGFLQDAGINITEMNSGCICCSLVGDFGKALQQVIAEFNPDRVIIEPSGVGKLSDVLAAVEKVTNEEVWEACRYVNADTFIRKLEHGLDEVVRERGNNFSAGQRQLLSFARTIIPSPA